MRVTKYIEIFACNSLVIGDTNNQCYDIIKINIVLVNNDISDFQIIDKILYYLSIF